MIPRLKEAFNTGLNQEIKKRVRFRECKPNTYS